MARGGGDRPGGWMGGVDGQGPHWEQRWEA